MTERARRRHRVWWPLSGVAALAVSAGSCSTTSTHALAYPGAGTGSAGAALVSHRPDQPFTLGALSLCVRGVPSVTVDAVRPVAARNLVVSDFTLRPEAATTEGLGETSRPLRTLGIAKSRNISANCHTPGRAGLTELITEYHRLGPGTGRDRGLQLDYKTPTGATGHLLIPFEVDLCTPTDHVGNCE